MRYVYIAFISFSIAFSSCNNASPNKGTEATSNPPAVAGPAQSKLRDEGTKKLMTMLSDYYTLKDAFVAANSTNVLNASGKFMTSIDSFKAYLNTDSINAKILSPYLDTAQIETNKILSIKDESCEKQRVPFSKISDQFFVLLKMTEVKNAGIYQQHCPMAFDEKGANWISNEAEIKNPYYGKKMLECGEVTDSLK